MSGQPTHVPASAGEDEGTVRRAGMSPFAPDAVVGWAVLCTFTRRIHNAQISIHKRYAKHSTTIRHASTGFDGFRFYLILTTFNCIKFATLDKKMLTLVCNRQYVTPSIF